ncbi:MAG: MBL fold metallo-hydrolase [Treponemataceae bacterium]|nr:MBL fold metallo-hydrolase [Treponemataceae bacterium]
MEKIIHLETGILQVNTYILKLNDCEAAVIDPGGNAEEIEKVLSECKLELKACLLTHAHFDHIGALKELSEKFPQSKLYVHKADSVYLGLNARKIQIEAFGRGGLAPYIEHSLPESLPSADVLLEGTETLFEDSVEFSGGFSVLHTPGHSAGSICFYCKAENLLFSGDTLFAGACGRTDLTGGSSSQMKQSLEMLCKLPKDTLVLPGHGAGTFIREAEEISIF